MTTTSSGHRLLLTLPDVAALARVQRPVVSMWRTRSAGTDHPFPEPAVRSGSQVLLDGHEVADWLVTTGHGNNPDVREEIALFAALDAAATAPGAPDQGATLAGLTALLALKATTGERLTGLTRADLLDLADDVDPHDAALYAEVAALGEQLPDLAAHADAVASAAYTPAAAVEALMVHRFRHGLRPYADTALSPAAVDVTARLAAAFLGDAAEPEPASETTVVDPSGGSDLLVALRHLFAEADLPAAALPPGTAGSPMVRLARRRLLAHGWWPDDVATDDAGRLALPGRTLVLAQFPSPARPVMSDEEVLAAIDDVAVAMDDDDRAVVVGPASAMADRPRSAAVDAARSAVLRTDRVRAVVRLPARLWTARSQQRLAIWVLGPAHPDVPIAKRWTTVADLGGVTLTDAVAEDVVTDVVAALADRATVRAHAFRFARFVTTSALLAGSGDLVGTPRPRPLRPRRAPAETALKVAELLEVATRAGTSAPDLRFAVEHREPASTRTATLGDLVAAGAARVIPGNRLDPADIAAGGSVRVIGRDEVLGARRIGERTLDRLTFSTRYPAGRYTEPGDVVFCTSPAMGAVVDVEGFTVVAAPARVLRLDRTHEPGLIADVVARDLRTASPTARWRSWAVRLAPASQAAALEATLAVVGRHRADAQARLRALSDLAATLTDGVVTGALVIPPPIPPQEG